MRRARTIILFKMKYRYSSLVYICKNIMKTTWQTTWKVLKDYPRLEGDMSADVVIVGGGITGITLAYLLAKKGLKPVVVEKGMLAESTTAYTTAFITYEVDTDLQHLRKIFGKDADLVWKSGKEAIDEIEKIIEEESIDCEFMRCPEYLFARSEKEWEAIRKEAELGKQAGFEIEVHGKDSSLPFPNHGYIIIKGQAKFHPLKYVDGLRQTAERHGAVFLENTEVTKIENVVKSDTKNDSQNNNRNNKDSVRAITTKGIITADWAVTATYSPFDQPKELFVKKGMYTSYIVELSIALGTLPAGIYLDGGNPYHYFRIDESKYADRMILGGEDHRKEIPMGENHFRGC